MTTQDDNFSKKLTGYLDIGTAELKAGTVYRLQNARAAALARLAGADGVRASESRLAHAFAGAGGSAPSGGRSLWTSARLWLGIAIIVAAGFGYQQWQAYKTSERPRGTGRPDPVVGPAHRRVPRPGIPQLARPRRKLTAALGLALGIAVLASLAPPSAHAQITMRSPSWSQLTPQEQKVLAPLAPEWDRLEPQSKQKWRGLAKRYPKMAPDVQQRVQQQMESWAKLTPQERAVAREQYKSIKQLPPEKKAEVRERWQAYQSLPPETRRELAAKPITPGGTPPKALHSPPPPTGAPAVAPPTALPSTPPPPAAPGTRP